MILYHGSYTPIERPDLAFSRLRTDFGKGFYLSPLKEQAVSWSERFIRERGKAFVTHYGFLHKAEEKLPDDIKILEFDTHSREWLDYITACRLGLPQDVGWDLVIGGVANDKVFDTLQLYFDELINADDAIRRLRYNKPNFQYCFKNQAIIDAHLRFIRAEELT